MEDPAVLTFLSAIGLAMRNGWFIIVSSSSGGCWETLSLPTAGVTSIRRRQAMEAILQLKIKTKTVITAVFEEKEAKIFMEKYNVATQFADRLEVHTGWNPLLLTAFAGCQNDENFEEKRKISGNILARVTNKVLQAISSQEFVLYMEDCHTWLVHACQNIPSMMVDLKCYEESYFAKEHLTYVDKDDENKQFYIKFAFPLMYVPLLKHFRKACAGLSLSMKPQIVYGYEFEERLLSRQLTELEVHIASPGGTAKSLKFAGLTLDKQLTAPLAEKLTKQRVYYLRMKHPVIDAIGLLQVENEEYLVMLQVSLSPHKDHRSKASDITKAVDKQERVACKYDTKLTIAEYYQKLAGVDDEHTAYIYTSPKQVYSCTTDNVLHILEVSDRELRRERCPKYSYGLVKKTSAAYTRMLLVCGEIGYEL